MVIVVLKTGGGSKEVGEIASNLKESACMHDELGARGL